VSSAPERHCIDAKKFFVLKRPGWVEKKIKAKLSGNAKISPDPQAPKIWYS
jgi:hypothetical protein